MMKIPLSEELRPQTLDKVVGQTHLVGEHGFLTNILKRKKPLSLLLFGPPGCGKTTIARIYAHSFGLSFKIVSAVFNSSLELKKLLKEGNTPHLFSQPTVLFIDEIHRFNRAQQDLFLPFLENGSLILVAATTENPSFSLNAALLSRLRVLELHPLDPPSLNSLIDRYVQTRKKEEISEEIRKYLISLSHGDGRHLLNLLENLEDTSQIKTSQDVAKYLQARPPIYDKKGEAHYNLISALHKSVRGSDPDAALYWLSRMLKGGEDPNFLGRRLVRMAIEDIGLADPEALTVTMNAWQAYERIGSPEGDLALAEAVVYLALSPKSTSLYTAFKKAQEDAEKTGELPSPKLICNAPTTFMKKLGYGKGYQYDPEAPLGFSGQNYFPEGLERPSYYSPIEKGFEREMKKRLDYFKKLRTHLEKTSPR